MITLPALYSLVFLALSCSSPAPAGRKFISVTSALTDPGTDWREHACPRSLPHLQGGIAAGSAAWGAVATRTGIQRPSRWPATMATIAPAVSRSCRKPRRHDALNHWRMPPSMKKLSALERPRAGDGPLPRPITPCRAPSAPCRRRADQASRRAPGGVCFRSREG